MNEFIPFALPDIGDDEINEVVSAMRSGWLTTGPKTKQFEQDFSAFLGGNGLESISVNSATAGLHLALEAIGLQQGDEVITSCYTFTATAEVVRYFGAEPVFCDIDPKTLNIDPNYIEAKITPRTKAIIPVHFAGLSCDMDAILSIAKKHNLRVIEDAAHALPTTYKKNLCGTFASDVTVFSFYATKTIATGEGGMVVTRDPAIAKRCKLMRLHGIDRDAFDRYTSKKPAWYYEVVAPGFKYNLTDIASSMGIHQLKKAWLFQEKRAAMAEGYDAVFAKLPVKTPPRAPKGDVHAWHLYVLRLEGASREQRDDFIQRMSAEFQVGCSVHFIPLHLQPYWRERYKLSAAQFPHATKAYEAAVSLPLYTKMNAAQTQRVADSVTRILQR